MCSFKKFGGVERASHQRRRKHGLKAHLFSDDPKFLELFRGHEPDHGMVFSRGLKVLSQSQEVAGNFPQVRHDPEDFLLLLASPSIRPDLVGISGFRSFTLLRSRSDRP